MRAKPPPFNLFFEVLFLESYSGLGLKEKKAIGRAVQFLVENPRHLKVHKAKNVQGKYPKGGTSVFIACAAKDLRITFEYGPEPPCGTAVFTTPVRVKSKFHNLNLNRSGKEN